MARKYVSLAIDHGTTNSCIARMTARGPEVIPAEANSSILPSAVFYDRAGALRVGSAAREAMIATTREDEGQGFTGYKLHIGSDAQYQFTACGKSLSAPELGAIVMQTLLRAYQRASGADPRACVITIPAKFKQNAVEGTNAAAEMAGLAYHPLIMEPVAAAVCYGFTAKQDRAQWMVFDLGGGTLDVSLVIARQGRLAVPDGGHAGDDNLGGRLFDQELAGWVLTQLETRYKLKAFREDRRRFSNEWGRLLLAVEAAKIELSDKSESVVELDSPLCRDDQGREVEVRVPVTRKTYEDLIRPSTLRAVEICRTLLKTNRMSSEQVERLILVGGPSKTPLIRQMLAERLGIRLEHSVNPMTAVAEGAAIWAETVEVPEGIGVAAGPAAGEYSVRVECDRQSSLPTYQAVGLVDGPPVEGWRVEVERTDGLWKSPGIAVDSGGVFTVELNLIEAAKPARSEFRTTLLDGQGRVLATASEPQIWFPSMAVENRLANSLRVAMKGNETQVLIPSGAELPAEGKGVFSTTKTLKKGVRDDELRIGIIESVSHLLGAESDRATGGLHVGTLVIRSGDQRVTMDVPEGSEVEVKLTVDESRTIRSVAYIALLDEEFEAAFVGETFQYKLTDIAERLEAAKAQLAAAEKFHSERPRPDVAEVLDSIRETGLLEGLDADLKRAAEGERDSEVRGYKRVLELEGTIREMHRRQMRDRITVGVGNLRGVVSGNDRQTLDDIDREFCRAESAEEVERCFESLGRLEFSVRGRPYVELLIDVMALSGLRVTSQQGALFVKATSLLDRIDANGGQEKLTDSHIAQLQEMHRELDRGYPELFKLRNKKLSEMDFGRGDVDLSHLTRR